MWKSIKEFFASVFRSLANSASQPEVDKKSEPKVISRPVVRKGSKLSDLVKIIQKAVGAKIDGKFGSQTESLVVDYQIKHGLVGDGVVGRMTWAKIDGNVEVAPPQSATPWMDIIDADIAAKVGEIPGPENHPVIVAAHKAAGIAKSMWHDLTAWCASYAKLVWIRAGVKPERIKDFKAWARDYLKFGVKLTEFRYGCGVVLERNGAGGDSHVTFGVKIEGDRIYCKGGNQSNKVCGQWYPLKDVLGYYWPSVEMLEDMGLVQKDPVIPAPKPPPTTSKGLKAKIGWEKKPEAVAWSEYAFDLLRGQYFETFCKASDITRFRSNFHSLTDDQKATILVEMISAIALPESGWKPTTRMVETTMGIDPITGKQVVSEGLLQLSYQDKQWAKPCRFNWEADKNLSATDPRKTILDPYVNLECGIGILARQITRTGKIILSSGVYWAVLKEGGKYQKIQQITASTQNLKLMA